MNESDDRKLCFSNRPTLMACSILAACAALLTVLWLLGGTPTARADPGVRYVALTGSDGVNDCSAVGNPCRTVQHAVDQALVGDEILVATGVYTGVQQRAGVTQTVYISQSVAIRGGYSIDFSTRDLDAYPTTLDAQGQGRVVYIKGNITPTLEGLHIAHGAATTGNMGDQLGAGIAAYSAHPIISGCHVFSNTAGNAGGGLFLSASARAVLIDNDIYDNVGAISGGGLYVGATSDSTLIDNRIHGNTASQGGGAIYDGSSRANLEGNHIYGNTATGSNGGGGILLMRSPNATLTGNTINGNTANHRGGGIALSSTPAAALVNNVVTDNQLSSGSGAGIHVRGSDARLLHNTFARNHGGDGSGVYVAGFTPSGQPYLPSVVALTNTILVSHTVGIVVSSNDTATLEATLWGADGWANGSDWSGAGAIFTGTINIWGDPAFVHPDGGDYHIRPASAALDAGVAACVTSDIDSDPRPLGSKPDLGADETMPFVYLPLVLRQSP